MDRTGHIRLLRHQIQEIEMILKGMDQTSSTSRIDIDLLLDKLRKLYDEVYLLLQFTGTTPSGPVPERAQIPIPEPRPEPRVEPKPEPKPQPKPEPRPQPQPAPIPDPKSTVTEDVRLNETLGFRKPAFDVASSLSEKPLENIFDAFGLNDLFLYTRELCYNNSEKFRATVNHLNQLTSFDEARTYLAHEFNWDQNNEVVKSFLNTVRRRYL